MQMCKIEQITMSKPGTKPSGRDSIVYLRLSPKKAAKLKLYAKQRNQSVSVFMEELLEKVPNFLEIIEYFEEGGDEENFFAA